MSRLTWINLGLALLAGALAWLLLAKPDADKGPSFKLSVLQAAQVQQITLSNPNLPRLVLRKQNNAWHLVEPLTARAEATRVESLLSLLQAKSEKQLPATELARFELDKPLARVSIDAQEFVFGANNPLSNQIYVMTGAQVYLVSPIYLADVVKPLSAFVAKALLGPDEIPVGFAFANLELRRDDGTWRSNIAHPQFSQDAANAFADGWKHALASDVRPATSLQNANTLRVTLQSGKTISLRYAQQGKEWLVQREDLPWTYHLSASDGQALLMPKFATSP